jgi:alginate O-acetyltransferase complex protein AlgI
VTSDLVLAALAAMVLFRWLPAPGPRREWLLVGLSSAWIAYQQPLALAVCLCLTLITCAFLREDLRARLPRAGMVGGLVCALALFRAGPELSQAWLHRPLPWPVPLGISFLILRLVGVVMDATALGVPVGARQLLLLATFFPTYRAGPLTTLNSLQAVARGSIDIRRAADRIVVGLARKFLLADLLLEYVVRPWSVARAPSLAPEECLLLPFATGLWIYWDFAGYSDIAIGSAWLLGYRVPENFDRPYWSRNLVEFWRRWHITLSDWIRLRVFLKLSGRRPSTWRVCAAAVVSMALCGLWHGPRAGFVAWGLWHGIGLAAVLTVGAAERRHPGLQRLLGRPWAAVPATALTYVWVSLGWLPFLLGARDSLPVAAKGFEALGHVSGALYLIVFIAGLLLASRIAQICAARWRLGAPELVRGAAYALVVLAIVAAASEPFEYFRF